MKVLVTGASGFLGRHLVPQLQRQGAQVTALPRSRDLDLRQRDSLVPLGSQPFDRIYHLAAWTKAGDFCLTHRGEQWLDNQLINTNVLWFWQRYQPQAQLVTMGTSCAYAPNGDLGEEHYLAGQPDPDLYTYAMTKRMLFEGCRALHHQFGMSYSYLVPSTLYGPGFDLGDSHFVFDLIKKIWAGKTLGHQVVLWGDGSQVRDIIHVGDAVRFIERAAQERPNQLLNLSSGVGYSIRHYAAVISEIIGFDPGQIRYDSGRFSGVPVKVLPNDRLRALGGLSFTDLGEGLRETVRHYAKGAGLAPAAVSPADSDRPR